MATYKGLELPPGTKVETRICLVNTVGVIIKPFNTEQDVEDHLRGIQEYIKRPNLFTSKTTEDGKETCNLSEGCEGCSA